MLRKTATFNQLRIREVGLIGGLPLPRKSSLPAARAVLLVLLVQACAAAFALQAGDWPRFLGPAGTGHSAETNLLGSWGAQGPPVRWSRTVGTGYSAPSVLGNRLVLHHREGNEEVIECMDPANGKPIWRHTYPTAYEDPYGYNNGPRCTPTLTTNRCFTFGAEGRLVCLDLNKGKVVWERQTQRDYEVPSAFFGVGSTPLLEGDRLLVMVGGQPNAGMVAFDAATGRTLWESVGEKNWTGVPMTGWPGERTVVWRRWEKQASYASPVAATVHGKRRIYCLMRQGLVSLDPQDGRIDDSFWFRARVDESVNAANPVVLGDEILITAAYYKVGSVLLAARRDDLKLEPRWQSTVLEVHWSTPILHAGNLYAFSGRNEPDARMRCVDFRTGKLHWERDESWRPRSSPTPPVYGRGSAIAADNRLIALGEGGLLGLFRLNPDRPEELARWQVPGLRYPCWAGPVLAAGHLFLRSEDRLVCIDLRALPSRQ